MLAKSLTSESFARIASGGLREVQSGRKRTRSPFPFIFGQRCTKENKSRRWLSMDHILSA
jgi:hypothetical protein